MTVLLLNFGTEWLIIIPIIFLLFGASRLPQLAKSLGQTRKAFKDGMREAEEEERIEAEQKQIKTVSSVNTSNALNSPQVTQLSDEELMAEMRRRAEAKQ
jgi:sec-independent protein translocase protein TatA